MKKCLFSPVVAMFNGEGEMSPLKVLEHTTNLSVHSFVNFILIWQKKVSISYLHRKLRNVNKTWKWGKYIVYCPVPPLETKHTLSKIMEKQTSKMPVPVQFFLISLSLCEKCPNTKFFLGRIFPFSDVFHSTDQKKLRIWTLFTQVILFRTFCSTLLSVQTKFRLQLVQLYFKLQYFYILI